MDRLPSESPKAYGALLAYLHLGRGRSQVKVADLLELPVTTVENYSRRHGWVERAAEHERLTVEKMFRCDTEESHREALEQFRLDQLGRAHRAGQVADALIEMAIQKLEAMKAEGELPPPQAIPGLCRVAATLTELSCNTHADGIGVSKLLEQLRDEREQ